MHQVDAIYTYFSKAFDVVNHKRLLWKLWNLGIRNFAFDWLKSFLTKHSQVVRLSGFQSHAHQVSLGVPQSSHHGPILFVLFINDLRHFINHAQFLLYAGDLKLFMPIKFPLDASNLQKDIDLSLNLIPLIFNTK